MNIKELIIYIFSSELQEELFIVKLPFIFFSLIFFVAVIFLLVNSSYLKYQSLLETSEFLTWKSYGLRKIVKRWKKIQKRIETGSEPEYKLAIVEADDFLNEVLEKKAYSGETFEERVRQVEKIQLPNLEEILEMHEIRNSIVYDPDYRLDLDRAGKILNIYETAIKNIEAF